MKHQGRGVIRLDDKTDHGGRVLKASSGTVVMGKAAALAGDMTHCPKCNGDFPSRMAPAQSTWAVRMPITTMSPSAARSS